MSEIPTDRIPVPLLNYVNLIRYRRSPYYDVVRHVLKEMEMHYKRSENYSEVIYAINPRILQGEIELKVNAKKLTTVNICRTILALFHGSKLREDTDFYVTTTSGGRRNYHIKVNPHTLDSISRFV